MPLSPGETDESPAPSSLGFNLPPISADDMGVPSRCDMVVGPAGGIVVKVE